MDFSALLTQIIGFVATPHAVAAFSVIVNIVLWRALQKALAEKDGLYDRFIAVVVEIIGDYHEFAHTLDRYVEAQAGRRESAEEDRRVDVDRAGA